MKKRYLFLYAVVAAFLIIILLQHTNKLPAAKLKQKEYVLTGTSLQTIREIDDYYETCRTVYDDSLYADEIVVTNEGSAGSKEVTTLVTYLNGRTVSEEVIDSRIVTPAIAREVHIGTKQRPDYIMPVSGYIITSGVGPRWGRTHCGIDLAVEVGTPVASSADGTVIQSGENGGYGISVYVDHGNGVITRYGHLSSACVSVGQTVAQGEIIGLSGNTGNSTGPHLHFEMRINNEIADPLDYVNTDEETAAE